MNEQPVRYVHAMHRTIWLIIVESVIAGPIDDTRRVIGQLRAADRRWLLERARRLVHLLEDAER